VIRFIVTGKADAEDIIQNHRYLPGFNFYEVADLVAQLQQVEPTTRPSACSILTHPLFWSAAEQSAFLLNVHDCAVPNLDSLYSHGAAQFVLMLSHHEYDTVNSWQNRVPDWVCQYKQANQLAVFPYVPNKLCLLKFFHDACSHLKSNSQQPVFEGIDSVAVFTEEFCTKRFPSLIIDILSSMISNRNWFLDWLSIRNETSIHEQYIRNAWISSIKSSYRGGVRMSTAVLSTTKPPLITIEKSGA
jgi:hypothetical protein